MKVRFVYMQKSYRLSANSLEDLEEIIRALFLNDEKLEIVEWEQ